jgi:hypothetical protein
VEARGEVGESSRGFPLIGTDNSEEKNKCGLRGSQHSICTQPIANPE